MYALIAILVILILLLFYQHWRDKVREGYRSCCWRGCTDNACTTRELKNTIAYNPFRAPCMEMGYNRGIIDYQTLMKQQLIAQDKSDKNSQRDEPGVVEGKADASA